jgi:hypothetical protein
MTDQSFPITPPPELVQQWANESPMECSAESWAYELFIAHHAAQWGADQELEACCEWTQGYAECGDSLRAALRPKPPSLKKEALLQLDTLNADLAMHGRGCDLSQIRRALEQLND